MMTRLQPEIMYVLYTCAFTNILTSLPSCIHAVQLLFTKRADVNQIIWLQCRHIIYMYYLYIIYIILGSTTIRLRTFRLRHFVYRHFVYYCIPACWTVIHPTSV